LYCECHQSKFDPRDQARVTDGPAPRNLPALPLRIVGGRLEVAGPFTARPGFEQGD
jgi:Rieske Fe-S protein